MNPRDAALEIALLEAALEYAGWGWLVLPLLPGGKAPLGRLVPKGLHDATTDPAVIRRWWTKCPNANVGLVTGVAFDVLDVDDRNGGIKTLVDALDRHGCLPGGPSVGTGGGGIHFYFEPTGLRCKPGCLPGIDWKGSGGYVVAPPSVHPNGEPYVWGIRPGEFLIPPAPPGELPIPPVQPWLLALIDPPPQPVTPPRPLRADSAYARAALEAEVAIVRSAGEGTRNDALNRASFNLGQLVAARLLDLVDVAEALAAAAEAIGLETSEFTKTIRSGLSGGMAQPRQMLA